MRQHPATAHGNGRILHQSLPLPIGLAALASFAFKSADLSALHAALTARSDSSGHPSFLLDLSLLETVLGNASAAHERQAQALARCRVFHRMSTAHSEGPRLLVVKASGGLMANTPLEFLLEHAEVRLEMAYCRPGEGLPPALPPHDALFVAIGESDEHRETLATLARQLADWPVPVLNRPEAILRLGRRDAAELLRGAPGMAVPRVIRATRDEFAAAYEELASASAPDASAAGPVLARPAHSHAGQGLQLLTARAAAPDYLAGCNDAAFYLSEYVDYRSADGLFRKYRIAFINGVAYPAHMAISSHWMIHYLNAGMTESAAKRDEEAGWMAQFDAAFARCHRTAFAALVDRVGLDYFVIDCGETRQGDLLIFETDAAMLVHAMDDPAAFAYKQAPMRRLFGAFESMVATVSALGKRETEKHAFHTITGKGCMQQRA